MKNKTLDNIASSYFCSLTKNDAVNYDPLNDKKLASAIKNIFVFVTQEMKEKLADFKKEVSNLCPKVRVHEIMLNSTPDDILMDSLAYKESIAIYKEAFLKGEDDFIFNGTGGTKQNLLIALEALDSIDSNQKKKLFLIPVKYDTMYFPYADVSFELNPIHFLGKQLKQAGYTVLNDGEIVKNLGDMDEKYYQASIDILSAQVIMKASQSKKKDDRFNMLAEFYYDIGQPAPGEKITLSHITDNSKLQARTKLLNILSKHQLISLDKAENPTSIIIADAQAKTFIKGGWYEVALYQKFSKYFKKKGVEDYQLWMNVKVSDNKFTQENTVGNQEIDLLLSYQSKLYIIEAKTGKVDVNMVSSKLKMIQDNFKNKNLISIIFGYLPILPESKQGETFKSKGVLAFYNGEFSENQPINYNKVIKEIIETQSSSL